MRRWLARARFRRCERREEWLPRILETLSLPPLDGGLAALRFWEQTGEPPQGWLAAADPVYFETRMNHLRLRAFPASELPTEDVRAIFERLQEALGGSRPQTFASAGTNGYLRLETPIPTAEISPAGADGTSPDAFLPEGPTAGAHDRLHSEVQMCLHDAAANERRIASGKLPVNALWLWGGGTPPVPQRRELPVLFAADEVVRGYWRSSQARAEPWPGSFGACFEAAGRGFVAVVPGPVDLPPRLAELRALLARGRLRQVTLLFRGGSSAELRRGDRFRFWRRAARPGEAV